MPSHSWLKCSQDCGLQNHETKLDKMDALVFNIVCLLCQLTVIKNLNRHVIFAYGRYTLRLKRMYG